MEKMENNYNEYKISDSQRECILELIKAIDKCNDAGLKFSMNIMSGGVTVYNSNGKDIEVVEYDNASHSCWDSIPLGAVGTQVLGKNYGDKETNMYIVYDDCWGIFPVNGDK